MFTVTPKATAKINALLVKQGKPEGFLRVSVASGGCSGLEYKLDIDDKTLPGEEVYVCGGARIGAAVRAPCGAVRHELALAHPAQPAAQRVGGGDDQ